jgi:hypothetical protein
MVNGEKALQPVPLLVRGASQRGGGDIPLPGLCRPGHSPYPSRHVSLTRCHRSSTSDTSQASAIGGRSSHPAPSTLAAGMPVTGCRRANGRTRFAPRIRPTTRLSLPRTSGGCGSSGILLMPCMSYTGAIWSAGVRPCPATAMCCWNSPTNDSASGARTSGSTTPPHPRW